MSEINPVNDSLTMTMENDHENDHSHGHVYTLTCLGPFVQKSIPSCTVECPDRKYITTNALYDPSLKIKLTFMFSIPG